MRKIVTGVMRCRVYDVLSRAVDEGVTEGWRKAHKHTDTPGEDRLRETIAEAVLSEILEYFTLDDMTDGE